MLRARLELRHPRLRLQPGPRTGLNHSYVCRCSSLELTSSSTPSCREYSSKPAQQQPPVAADHDAGPTEEKDGGAEEVQERQQGAMSRRLAQLASDVQVAQPRGASRTPTTGQGAQFDPDLKAQLEARISSASFNTEHASAIAQSSLPASTGAATRAIAGAQPWTGTESIEDATLRMLTDAHKPLRSSSNTRGSGPPVAGPRLPRRIDVGRPSSRRGQGQRLADARDRSSVYAAVASQDNGMSAQEREEYRREMRERFQPHARAVPGTIQGLASLANERIEDAIARGQFRNLPRGKKLEADPNASSPFLDTTEYFMNKIIQKQDITPPWIEKQQELAAAVVRFRGRLRNDWKRHAARMIASKGGTLSEQVRRAETYARAEVALSAPPAASPPEPTLISEAQDGVSDTPPEGNGPDAPSAPQLEPSSSAIAHPFRDPIWEATEASYLELSIKNLNTLTRNYNLQAPELAKKPYFHLTRELRSCFADSAPLIPQEIIDRARSARSVTAAGGSQASVTGSMMRNFGAGVPVKIRDEVEGRRYGMKELWRDLFARGGGNG